MLELVHPWQTRRQTQIHGRTFIFKIGPSLMKQSKHTSQGSTSTLVRSYPGQVDFLKAQLKENFTCPSGQVAKPD